MADMAVILMSADEADMSGRHKQETKPYTRIRRTPYSVPRHIDAPLTRAGEVGGEKRDAP